MFSYSAGVEGDIYGRTVGSLVRKYRVDNVLSALGLHHRHFRLRSWSLIRWQSLMVDAGPCLYLGRITPSMPSPPPQRDGRVGAGLFPTGLTRSTLPKIAPYFWTHACQPRGQKNLRRKRGERREIQPDLHGTRGGLPKSILGWSVTGYDFLCPNFSWNQLYRLPKLDFEILIVHDRLELF